MNFKKAVFSVFVIIMFVGMGLFVFQNREEISNLGHTDARGILLFFREKLSTPNINGGQNLITGYAAAEKNTGDFYASLEDFSIYLVMLSCLVVVVFFFAGISARVDSENDSRKMLVQYIKLAKQNDFKKEEIKKRLNREGWQEDKMEKAFNRVDFEQN